MRGLVGLLLLCSACSAETLDLQANPPDAAVPSTEEPCTASFSPRTLDFGSVERNVTVSRSVHLLNQGDHTCVLTSLVPDSDGPSPLAIRLPSLFPVFIEPHFRLPIDVEVTLSESGPFHETALRSKR